MTPTQKAAALLGRKGGRSKSAAKSAAARENGKAGNRKPDADLSAGGWYRRAQVLDRQGKPHLANESRKIASRIEKEKRGLANQSGHPVKSDENS